MAGTWSVRRDIHSLHGAGTWRRRTCTCNMRLLSSSPMEMNCGTCGSPVEWSSLTKSQKDKAKSRGRAYCTKECGLAAIRAMRLAEAPARSERMRGQTPWWEKQGLPNPSQVPEYRDKATATLKAMGHRPRVQGGNGRDLPEPHKMLWAKFPSWRVEFPVGVGKVFPGMPTHYMIDLANLSRKIAVEIDGGSHLAKKVRDRDARKDKFLRGLGWTVLRFTNQEVMDNLGGCVLAVRRIIYRSQSTITTSSAPKIG